MRIYLPETKVEKILEKIRSSLSSSWVHVREVASVVGNLQAGARALGEQAVRVCTRALYRDVDKAPTWEWNLRLTDESRDELKFWEKNLVSLNSSPLRRSQVPVLMNFLLAGDASGVGGFLGNFSANETLLSIPFTADQMEQSSTWRELFVLHKFYTSGGAEAFKGQTILHLCDNAGVASIIRKGSPRALLAEMSRDIFLACRRLDIELIVNWESREAELMELADAGSRGPWLLEDEFQMDFDSYADILSRYNPSTILTLS